MPVVGVVPLTTLVVLFLIVVVCPGPVTVVVEVSVVVFGGAVIVVETVVVMVVSVVDELLVPCAEADPVQAMSTQAASAPARSATGARIASFRAGFTTASLALPDGEGNTANMPRVGKPAPPFRRSAGRALPSVQEFGDTDEHRHRGHSIGLVGTVP